MKIKTGDKYKLDGACQYGYTRDGIRIRIDPYDIVTKIRDTIFDVLSAKSMYRLDDTGWEISIDDSIIERYFRKYS